MQANRIVSPIMSDHVGAMQLGLDLNGRRRRRWHGVHPAAGLLTHSAAGSSSKTDS
jgi:hypothetical protein